LLINVLLLTLIEKPGKVISKNSLFDVSSPWAYLYEYSNLFQFHIYFLWIMQSTGEKQQRREGNKMSFIVSISLFVFIVLFSIFGFIGYTSNRKSDMLINQYEFETFVIQKSVIGNSYYLMNIIVVFIGFPFKFYLGKEFLFIFLDEVINKSLS
jgi:hypothetical protein